MWKKLTVFGMIGALAYLLHVVLGGALWNGYNHLMQPISDLTASGAPNYALISTITWIYGICVIIFGLSALIYLRTFAPKLAQAGMLIFLVMQIVSTLYGFFPEDLPGAAVTAAGTMHIVITAIIVPLTILAPFLIGFGLRKLEGFEGIGRYSIVTGVIILVFGSLSAVFFANMWPYFGLIERINIGALQLWTFILSYRLFKEHRVQICEY